MNRQPEPESMDLDHEARAYAEADFASVNQAFAERLAALAPSGPCPALDLGCGPGDIPLRVSRVRPEWRVVAVDSSRPMLELAARARAGEDIPGEVFFVQGDAKALPFPDQSFTVVFSNSILHHITETGHFWSEVARVLRPGGTLFVRDLARPESEVAAAEIVDTYAENESELLREEFYRSLLSAYTPEEVSAQLAGAGLPLMAVTIAGDRHLDVFGSVPAM